MKNYLIILLTIITGCGLFEEKPTPIGDESPEKEFIQILITPSDLESNYSYWDSTEVEFSDLFLLYEALQSRDDWNYSEPSKQERDNFRKLIGDDHFNRGRTFVYDRAVFTETLVGINISSDRIYNTEKNLEEIVKIGYEYPGLYVKNDYTWEGAEPSPNTVSGQISETLKSFNGWGSKLGICTDFSFQLLEAPAKTDTFHFTIRYEFEGGKIIETTTPPAIIQGLED